MGGTKHSGLSLKVTVSSSTELPETDGSKAMPAPLGVDTSALQSGDGVYSENNGLSRDLQERPRISKNSAWS